MAKKFLLDDNYDSAIAILKTEADKFRNEKELYNLLNQ